MTHTEKDSVLVKPDAGGFWGAALVRGTRQKHHSMSTEVCLVPLVLTLQLLKIYWSIRTSPTSRATYTYDEPTDDVRGDVLAGSSS